MRLHIGLALFAAACAPRAAHLELIPVPTGTQWATVFRATGFQIVADTQHIVPVPAEHAMLVWFVTLHDEVRHADSLTFNRSRIRLLVRCRPFGFRSVSQDLTLDDAPPRSHIEWQWTGPKAPPWRVPETGATDDQFLRKTCALIGTPAS